MKINTLFAGGLMASSMISFAHAQTVFPVEIPMKANFHLFLLAGQSNMAGRGDVEAEDKKPHPRVLMLTQDGTWLPAVDPIHYDKPVAGVGPGKTFGLILADKDTNITIGLIPAACGGSPLSAWEPGAWFDQTASHPYDDALRRVRLAMKQGTLKAVLWHQGESDCHDGLAQVYQTNLEQVITRFRKDLNNPDLPVIIGQLGQFEGNPWTQYTKRVDEAQIAVSKKLTNVVFVPAQGLTSKADHLHFDSRSQREFGRRYAAAYLEMQTTP